jgi:membrane protein DedA with SNARE-associated domain
MSTSIGQAYSGIAILVIVFFAQALKEMGLPSLGLTHSLLLYAGYQFSSGNPDFGMAIILFTFMGSLCGASLIFCLARFNGNKLLEVFDHFGIIKPKAMKRARLVLIKSSFVTISIGRSIPGLMLPTSILAGTLDFPIPGFYIGIVFTLSLWVIVIVKMGTTFSHFIPRAYILPERLIYFLIPPIGIGILSGVLYLQKRIRSRIAKVNHKQIQELQH